MTKEPPIPSPLIDKLRAKCFRLDGEPVIRMDVLEGIIRQHEAEDGYQYPYIKVGKYYLAAYPEYIWIGLEDGAEGGGFDAGKVEAVIDKFYGENF